LEIYGLEKAVWDIERRVTTGIDRVAGWLDELKVEVLNLIGMMPILEMGVD